MLLLYRGLLTTLCSAIVVPIRLRANETRRKGYESHVSQQLPQQAWQLKQALSRRRKWEFEVVRVCNVAFCHELADF
ncbi:MAG TPA: hypothetical protein VFN25_11895 [Dokdonella sp.]|uniref:hypothetical protein n=1 Tax=Dokdonella sp. TaxID=2291710 RepID=UPI002D7F2515|nr:hypothetical protein [Dokdonella sp.]HET9033597.1 hypothetical protein [Dokdonella sp.]